MLWEVTAMFETIRRLYLKTGRAAIVEAAVRKGWITQEQGEEIVKGVNL